MNYLRLYRPDAFLITFISFIVPLVYIGIPLGWNDLILGLLISGISVNAIYTLNSYFDADIDRVNKPERPLPSGALSKKNAFVYATGLIILSVLYPLFLQCSWSIRILLEIFPVIALLYSNSVFPFKKFASLAVVLTSILLVLPMLIGLHQHALLFQYKLVVGVFFGYCLAVIPLKDIEDEKGDVQFDSQNWAAIFGVQRLIALSLACQGSLLLIIYTLIDSQTLKAALIAFVMFNMLVTAAFYFSSYLTKSKLYKSLILLNISIGFVAELLFHFVL